MFCYLVLHKANYNLPFQFFSLPQLGALLMDNHYTTSETYRPRRKPSAAPSTAAWRAPASFPVLKKLIFSHLMHSAPGRLDIGGYSSRNKVWKNLRSMAVHWRWKCAFSNWCPRAFYISIFCRIPKIQTWGTEFQGYSEARAINSSLSFLVYNKPVCCGSETRYNQHSTISL